MRTRYIGALGEPGEIVRAVVRNSLENPASRGKARPVVLIHRDGGHWLVMGLTTKSAYADGTARSPVPFPTTVGLRGPGYLWGTRLTKVSVLDIDRHLGWVDMSLAALIIGQARLNPQFATSLLRATERRAPSV